MFGQNIVSSVLFVNMILCQGVKHTNFVSRPFVNWQKLRFVTRGISFHCVPTTRPSSWSRGLSAPVFDCYCLASEMTAFRVYKISSFSVALWISRSLDVDTGRKVAALMFSNSAAVRCTLFGRYALESVSATLSVTLILHLIIIFPKSHHHNVKAFWRKRERLLQDGF